MINLVYLIGWHGARNHISCRHCSTCTVYDLYFIDVTSVACPVLVQRGKTYQVPQTQGLVDFAMPRGRGWWMVG